MACSGTALLFTIKTVWYLFCTTYKFIYYLLKDCKWMFVLEDIFLDSLYVKSTLATHINISLFVQI
jgi:hypothetical protein